MRNLERKAQLVELKSEILELLKHFIIGYRATVLKMTLVIVERELIGKGFVANLRQTREAIDKIAQEALENHKNADTKTLN